MRIVIFNWRDLGHPKAGGAEVATDQLATGLAARGHNVTFFTSAHPGARAHDERNGYRVIRRGSELTCRFHAWAWLFLHRNEVDIAVDEVNTLPFLSRLVMGRRHVVWMLQLAREVWLLEAPGTVGRIGRALEPLMLRVYRNSRIITISQSSARTFRSFGMRGPIHVAEIALRGPSDSILRTQPYRLGYVGRIAPSKRIDHILQAVRILAQRFPQMSLVLVGGGPAAEADRLRKITDMLGVAQRVTFAGRVLEEERDAIMAGLDVLVMTSAREGWGLVVSEAARYGVPSVVYPVPGLIDSVRDGETGLVSANETPEALAEAISRVLEDRNLRDRLGAAARQYLSEFDDERFVGGFERALKEQISPA